jgi:hypothetical protein
VRRCALVIALGLLAVGCPGRLQDPQRFETACPAGFDVEVDLFQQTCGTSGCHTTDAPQGGLDLSSPGVASRLILQPSHTCPGHILITGPDAGFVFDKLSVTSNPACGAAMPLGKPSLTNDQMVCLVEWAAAALADAGVLGP